MSGARQARCHAFAQDPATCLVDTFRRLLVLLDPDVIVRADRAAVQMGTADEVHGAAVVADAFVRRFRGVRPALINGALGAVWAPRERPCVAFVFTVAQERITSVELLADPEQLQKLGLEILDPR